MSEQQELHAAAGEALADFIASRRERGVVITPDVEYRASGFLALVIPLAKRWGISEHGVTHILARAALDAVLAPPRKLPRKERLRQAREGSSDRERSRTEQQ